MSFSSQASVPNIATEKHKGEAGVAVELPESSKGVEDMGGIPGDDREEAQMPAFIELVWDARVFANCKSWKIRYRAKEKDVFMPLSTPKHYNDFSMIPIYGQLYLR